MELNCCSSSSKIVTRLDPTQKFSMMIRFLIGFVLVVSAVSGQSFNCPKDNGYFPHDRSCDKYWKCDEGRAELKVCGNGLAFDDTDPRNQRENCDYVYNVDCGDRDEIEPAISTPHCPRLYGVFPDDTKCDVFWSCWNGEASRYQCAPGLAYSRDSRVCTWADQVADCREEEVSSGFKCPDTSDVSAGAFSRHAHPDDCRKYYVCMNNNAREYGCPLGTVFKIGDDDVSGFCADPEEVAGCEEYYGDLDLANLRNTEVQSGLAERPTGKKSTVNRPAVRRPAATAEEE